MVKGVDTPAPVEWDSGERPNGGAVMFPPVPERERLRAVEALHASTLGVLLVVGCTIIAANPAACLFTGLEPPADQPLPAWLEGVDDLTRAAGTLTGPLGQLAFIAAPARLGGVPHRVVVIWRAGSDGHSA